MPLVTGRHKDLERVGPQLPIAILPSERYRQALHITPERAPEPIQGMALIDTGASCSIIQSGTAKQLGLSPIGQETISTASSEHVPCDQYDIDLLFPTHNVRLANLVVLGAPIRFQPITCLIGRDILSKAMFVYIGYDNSFTLAF